MLIAIPLDSQQRVYHHNPCSAPMFALYQLSGDRSHVRFRHVDTKLNPWQKVSGEMVCDSAIKECSCDSEKTKDPHHISDHYALLEAIGKCDCLLVDQYCLNILYALRNVDIKIYKLPPFIKTAHEAMHHFIIGTNITDDLRHIHPAS